MSSAPESLDLWIRIVIEAELIRSCRTSSWCWKRDLYYFMINQEQICSESTYPVTCPVTCPVTFPVTYPVWWNSWLAFAMIWLSQSGNASSDGHLSGNQHSRDLKQFFSASIWQEITIFTALHCVKYYKTGHFLKIIFVFFMLKKVWKYILFLV